jgi:hypothetical protein
MFGLFGLERDKVRNIVKQEILNQNLAQTFVPITLKPKEYRYRVAINTAREVIIVLVTKGNDLSGGWYHTISEDFCGNGDAINWAISKEKTLLKEGFKFGLELEAVVLKRKLEKDLYGSQNGFV